jgi:hypothetical protein
MISVYIKVHLRLDLGKNTKSVTGNITVDFADKNSLFIRTDLLFNHRITSLLEAIEHGFSMLMGIAGLILLIKDKAFI